MNRSTLSDLFTLARELPSMRVDTYLRLCRIANRHRRLCEHACNVGMDDAEQEAHENKLTTLAIRFQMLYKEIVPAGRVLSQRDPRGPTLRLILPSGKSNSWDGETWCL